MKDFGNYIRLDNWEEVEKLGLEEGFEGHTSDHPRYLTIRSNFSGVTPSGCFLRPFSDRGGNWIYAYIFKSSIKIDSENFLDYAIERAKSMSPKEAQALHDEAHGVVDCKTEIEMLKQENEESVMNNDKLTPVEALKIAQKLFRWANYIACDDVGGRLVWHLYEKKPWIDTSSDSLEWILSFDINRSSGKFLSLDLDNVNFDGTWQESRHDVNGRVYDVDVDDLKKRAMFS